MAWNDLTPRERADTLAVLNNARGVVGEFERARKLSMSIRADLAKVKERLESILLPDEVIPHDGKPGARRLTWEEWRKVLVDCEALAKDLHDAELRIAVAGPTDVERIL